jgi:hypothetical protein
MVVKKEPKQRVVMAPRSTPKVRTFADFETQEDFDDFQEDIDEFKKIYGI